MKTKTRCRPAVESLESMLLLSAATAELAPRIQVLASAQVAQPTRLALDGTLAGTVHTDDHLVTTYKGAGNLGRVGAASFAIVGSPGDPNPTLNLATRKGSITLAVAFADSGSGGPASRVNHGRVEVPATYTIVGGTGSYAHAAGSGKIDLSQSLSTAGVTLKFS